MDSNERAFYDSHRNAPVATTDNDLYDHVRGGETKLNKRRPGDPGVRLEQLMRFFDPRFSKKVDDSKEVCTGRYTADKQGFYSVYRNLFDLLASDEQLHSSEVIRYPSFGDSTTLYAPPSGLTRRDRDAQSWARDFYTVWTEFATEKRFEWVGKWDVDRGEDRGMRRLMDKENKKTREEYRREYNDNVRVSPPRRNKLISATRPLCSKS